MHDIKIEHLQLAISVAWQARRHGNHPFGAVLVNEHDQVLLQAENTVMTGQDVTRHAETNIVTPSAEAGQVSTLPPLP